MKKIITIALITMFLLPNLSFAMTRAETEKIYIETLQAVINLLILQVQKLTEQLNLLSAKVDTIPNIVAPIEQTNISNIQEAYTPYQVQLGAIVKEAETPKQSAGWVIEPIKKELKIYDYNCGGIPTRCEGEVWYLENGKRKFKDGISLTSTGGEIRVDSTTGGEHKMVKSGYDGQPTLYFYHFPYTASLSILTATFGDLIATTTTRGKF